jgi:hypothetical protein
MDGGWFNRGETVNAYQLLRCGQQLAFRPVDECIAGDRLEAAWQFGDLGRGNGDVLIARPK